MTAPARERPRSLADRLVKGPVGFRRALERLGPTFIKMGQFLALRPDLIPQDYCDELLKLLDRVDPFPWPEARSILQEEFGTDPSNLFVYIDPNPVASGSLAQTHLARLGDGTELALKILRPGIADRVKIDLVRARRLARILEASGISFITSPSEVTEEITEWMMQEIDFVHELSNVARLHRLTQGSRIEKVPRPYPTLCSARVLAMEYIRGIPFSNLISWLRVAEGTERIQALGIDCDHLSANLLEAVLGQVFRYKFFHADLHPGNLLALPGNVIGFVDFGLCDALDETVRERQVRYLTAVYNRDIDGMFQAISEVLIPSETTDMDAFRTDFFAETQAYLSRTDPSFVGTQPPSERSPIAEWMIHVVRSAQRNHLRLPPSILTMYRALLTTETVARQLGGKASLRAVGRSFFKRLRLEELVSSFGVERMESFLLTMTALCQDSPRQLQQILSDVAAGRMKVTINVEETPRVRRLRNRRTRMLATAILTVAVATLFATTRSLTVFKAFSLTWPLGVLLGLLFAAVFWQWSRLR